MCAASRSASNTDESIDESCKKDRNRDGELKSKGMVAAFSYDDSSSDEEEDLHELKGKICDKVDNADNDDISRSSDDDEQERAGYNISGTWVVHEAVQHQ